LWPKDERTIGKYLSINITNTISRQMIQVKIFKLKFNPEH